MENKKTYMVKLTGFSDETYKFRCQENTGWNFWKSFEVELPSVHFEWLWFDEAKEIVQDYLNGNELYEEKAPPNPVDTVTKKHVRPARMSRWNNVAFGVAVMWVCVIWLSMWWLFSWWDTEAKEVFIDQIFTDEYYQLSDTEQETYLKDMIWLVRWQREDIYDNCVSMCKAERQSYDAVVTKMKWEKSIIELEQQKHSIPRVISNQ